MKQQKMEEDFERTKNNNQKETAISCSLKKQTATIT